MDRSFRPTRTSSDADLAFAVVVLASYFTTFSVLQNATTSHLLGLIALGVAYIAVGIYGYAYVAHAGKKSYYVAYFIVQLLLGGFIILLGKGVGYNAMILLPLAGHSVMLLPRNQRLAVNVAIVATFAVALGSVGGNWGAVWAGLPLFLAGQIFIVIFTQMAVSEEKARSEVELLVRELEDANQKLRDDAIQAEELTITKERNRMAREIHDGLGHYLTTIHMQIQAARAVMKADPQKAQESLATAQSQTQAALVDVRRSVSALREMPGDSTTLREEIEKMLKGCENGGITSEIKVIGATRTLSPQAILTVYRTVQEGINNAVKHAKPSHICVTIDYSQSSEVRCIIQDDGVGAENIEGGFGILGIRERVNMLNGKVDIVTAPGSGFRLDISVPG